MSSKLPRTDSIEELARFWTSHDLTDFEDDLVEVGEPVFVRNGATILGRGEDALTLWALTAHLPALLGFLREETPPHQATVIYRPGFGRGDDPGAISPSSEKSMRSWARSRRST